MKYIISHNGQKPILHVAVVNRKGNLVAKCTRKPVGGVYGFSVVENSTGPIKISMELTSYELNENEYFKCKNCKNK